jgi:7-cyano-7-deazaguanine reductase
LKTAFPLFPGVAAVQRIMEQDFKALGRRVIGPSKELDTFPKPANVTVVKFSSAELTSNCPVTGQPDFYTVEMLYHPNQLCIESKSMKLYLWSFREEAMFAETLAHIIAQKIYQTTQAHYVRVTLTQSVRGGLALEAVAEVGESWEKRPS